jgi:uncharacterized protein
MRVFSWKLATKDCILFFLIVVPSHGLFVPSVEAFSRSHSIRLTSLLSPISCRKRLLIISPSRESTQATIWRPVENIYETNLVKPSRSLILLRQSMSTPEKEDDLFDGRTTLALVGGQSVIIVAAILAAFVLGTPNWGLGPGVSFNLDALQVGTLCTVPLFALAAALDLIEDRFPALQDVTKATYRSVLALLGGTFKPTLALVTATALGLVAGLGEEMLFRGVLQYELAERFGPWIAVGVASIVFGVLHAVTPAYAALAGMASLYFGSLYLYFDNLGIPIFCHAIYDVGALYYAHWTVSQLPAGERKALANWKGPGTENSATTTKQAR